MLMKILQPVLLVIALFALPLLAASCVAEQYLETENYTVIENVTEYRTETYNAVESVSNPVCDSERLDKAAGWYTSYYIVNNAFQNIYYFDYDMGSAVHDKIDLKLIFPRQLQGEYGQVNVYDLTGVGHIEAPPSVGIIQFNWISNYRELEKLQQWANSFNAKIAAAKLLSSQPYQTTADSTGPEIEINTAGARLVGVVINGPKYFWNVDLTARLVYCDNHQETKTVVKERQVPYQVPTETTKERQVTKTHLVPFWKALFK
jgi:hypothetical protein